MDLASLREHLESLERDTDLWEETALQARAEAWDWLRFAQGSLAARKDRIAAAMLSRVAALMTRIENTDEALFARFYAALSSGQLRGADLRAYLARFTEYRAGRHQRCLAPDGLDLLLNGALHREPIPQGSQPLETEMVHFEQTPARLLLELSDRVPLGPDDCFYDLGCGLGRIPILIHLLTGVEAVGVEIDPEYCAYARRCTIALGLTGVRFVNADVRRADLSRGTVFFMFTPFVGSVLARVLTRLHHLAMSVPITLGTYGPITPIVARQPWLHNVAETEDPYRLGIFASRMPSQL